MAVESNIGPSSWFINADHSIRIDVVQADGVTPQTMTGWALEFTLRAEAANGTGTEHITKTTAGGAVTIGNGAGTNDRATVTILAADTATLKEGKYYEFALWRTDTGSRQPLVYGTAYLTAPAIA